MQHFEILNRETLYYKIIFITVIIKQIYKNLSNV